ncbi:MAG: hypothetical protein QG648_318 [Patescibacteria group bacterium]|nr:hypothetical protein [Patescibacteria group bacterium]
MASKQKRLFIVKVLNFCQDGGKIIRYYLYAYSEAQAKLLAARKFNQDFNFTKDNFVEMILEEIPRRNTKNKRRY